MNMGKRIVAVFLSFLMVVCAIPKADVKGFYEEGEIAVQEIDGVTDDVRAPKEHVEFSKISGKVIDSEGNGVEGVSVQLYNIDENELQTMCVTNSGGNWISAEYDIVTDYTYIVRYYKTGYTFSDNNIHMTAINGGSSVDDVTAYAVEVGSLDCNEADYEYTVTDKKVTITRYKGSSKAIRIPEELEGYPVVSLSYTFEDNISVETVWIPDTVLSIMGCFSGCTSLKNVYLSSSLTRIDDCAFSGCRNLGNLVFPNGLKKIGYNAFCGCSKMTEMDLPDGVESIGDLAFESCSNLEYFHYPMSWGSTSDIYGYSDTSNFAGCVKLKEVIIPEGTKAIAQSAFANSSFLEKVVLPSTLVKIDDYAFYNCENMNTSTPVLPKDLERIGWYAFYGCKNLGNVIFPDGLKTVEGFAFSGCM